MIINNGYFKNEIYIPHAKPTITDNVTQVSESLSAFIEKYERDCLIKCLGYNLAIEFIGQLDSAEDNGLKIGADQKWDDLLNGKEAYVAKNGETRTWEGIRRKTDLTSEFYDSSFIANYIYWFFEKSNHIQRSGIGNQRNLSKNAENEMPNDKVVRAQREFVDLVQGKVSTPRMISNRFGRGIDWYNASDRMACLYGFINDMNDLVEDTYSDFAGIVWKSQNIMGI